MHTPYLIQALVDKIKSIDVPKVLYSDIGFATFMFGIAIFIIVVIAT